MEKPSRFIRADLLSRYTTGGHRVWSICCLRAHRYLADVLMISLGQENPHSNKLSAWLESDVGVSFAMKHSRRECCSTVLCLTGNFVSRKR